jgi:predicted PurR-regulated permease PerM
MGAATGGYRSTVEVSPTSPSRVHPTVARLAAYGWRLLVLAAVVVGIVWLIGRLRVVVFPVILALFAARVLRPVAGRLAARGWRPALAAATTMVGALVVLAAVAALIVPAVAGEFDDLGPTLTEAVDDVEEWLVEDSPFNVDREDIERWRGQIRNAADSAADSNSGLLVRGATIALEVVAGLFLAVIVTFFFLKDGPHFRDAALRRFRPDRRQTVARMADRAWETLGGYLRGAAILGVVESIAIGLALLLTGSSLVVPMMVLTFAAAFVPFVGAIVAGVVATLVALATGGPVAALVVAAVAIIVQQLDNDVLAPWVYGRAFRLHPLVVLLSIVAGGALFGIAGTVLAVPVTAVAINVAREWSPGGPFEDGDGARRPVDLDEVAGTDARRGDRAPDHTRDPVLATDDRRMRE